MMKKMIAIGVFFFMTISALSFGELKPGKWKGTLIDENQHLFNVIWHVDKSGYFSGTGSDKGTMEVWRTSGTITSSRNGFGGFGWIYHSHGKTIPFFLNISFNQPYAMHVKAFQNQFNPFKMEGDLIYSGS